MLGLINFIVLTLIAVVAYFTLPDRYRRLVLLLACGYMYMGSSLSTQSEYTYNDSEDLSYGVTPVSAGTSWLFLHNISQSDSRIIEVFGSNNRQRFKNLTNIRLFQCIYHGLYKLDFISNINSARNYSFHNLLIKDRYISFLVRLKE
jgi:hypothetical protein